MSDGSKTRRTSPMSTLLGIVERIVIWHTEHSFLQVTRKNRRNASYNYPHKTL